MNKKIHYGWFIVAACFLINFCIIGITSLGVSVFLPALRTKLGLTGAQSSFVLSIQGITTIVSLKIAGSFYKKYSPRAVCFVFGLFAVLGFLVMAHSQSIGMLYAGAALTGITLGGGGHIPTTSLVNRWFSQKRGTAIGMYSVGSSMSGILFVPIISWVIQTSSLMTAFYVTAILILACQCIAFLIIRDSPADKGLQPLGYGDAPAAANKAPAAAQAAGITYREAHRMPRYYLLAFVIFAIGFTVKPALSHRMIYAVSIGFDQLAVSAAISVASMVSFVTTPIYGMLKDKFGTSASNWYIFTMWTLALLSFSLITYSPFMIYIVCIICTFGSVIGSMSSPFWVTDLFGTRDYGQIYSDMLIFSNIGIIVGSYAFGAIADLTGTYLSGYKICAVLVVICLVITQSLYRSQSRKAVLSETPVAE